MNKTEQFIIPFFPHNYNHPFNLSIIISDIIKNYTSHKVYLFDDISGIKVLPSKFGKIISIFSTYFKDKVMIEIPQDKSIFDSSPYGHPLKYKRIVSNIKPSITIDLHVANHEEFLDLQNQLNSISIICPYCNAKTDGAMHNFAIYVFQGKYHCKNPKYHFFRNFIFNICKVLHNNK